VLKYGFERKSFYYPRVQYSTMGLGKSTRWTARLAGTLHSVDATPDPVRNTVVLRFFIPSSTPFRLEDLPDWTIQYEGESVTRLFGDVWGIAQDTIMESEPKIRLSYQCTDSVRSTTKARLVDVVWGGEATVVHDGDRSYELRSNSERKPQSGSSRCHYLHLEVQLEEGESIPDTLCDCHLILSGHPLSEDRFRYGYCDRFSKGDRSCTFRTYLETAWKYGSNKAVGREGEVCRAFRLEKGSIQQYCHFVT